MNAARRITLADNRATLATVQGRLVRCVLGENTPYTDALIAVLLERRFDWTMEAWEALLEELGRSNLTVGEWLVQEHARAAA